MSHWFLFPFFFFLQWTRFTVSCIIVESNPSWTSAHIFSVVLFIIFSVVLFIIFKAISSILYCWTPVYATVFYMLTETSVDHWPCWQHHKEMWPLWCMSVVLCCAALFLHLSSPHFPFLWDCRNTWPTKTCPPKMCMFGQFFCFLFCFFTWLWMLGSDI